MTAAAEDMEKFMAKFVKAMGTMAEKEKEKTFAKVFSKDFMKEAKEFNGDKDAYHLWQFKWRLEMQSNKKFYEVIKFIEKQEDEITHCGRMDGMYPVENLEYRMEEWSTELFDVLAKKLVGDALTTMENVTSLCGFEVWRLLARDCNPTSPAMALKALMEVLVPKRCAHEQDLSKAIDVWQIKLAKVDSDHGEHLKPQLKIAIVAAMCPAAML